MLKLLKQDLPAWTAILFLILGLSLMDRSFAYWRNDSRNFRTVEGKYRVGEQGDEHRTFFENHVVLESMCLSGLVLFVASVGLFTKLNAEQKVHLR